MVCESYEVLNVNVVVTTVILSFAAFIFSVLPEELVNKNAANFPWLIVIISSFAIICIAYTGIVMNNKEKKYQQILSVLKDIEKEVFTDEVIQE